MKIIRDENGKVIGVSLYGFPADVALSIVVIMIIAAAVICRASGG